MYLPHHFTSDDPALAARLAREHPFASLVSNDDDGFPFVTHLPLHLLDDGGDWTLLGHCARANPHAGYLARRPQALVTFLGPHAYLSPQVYPDLARVPTWNYLALHCKVEARILDGDEAKDALLKQLIADHEPGYAQQWRDMDPDFAHRMLGGIVAFELKVLARQHKIKLNQHRRESHAAMWETYRAGSPDEQALGRWMADLGLAPSEARPAA
jgi:transcriptional regulator